MTRAFAVALVLCAVFRLLVVPQAAAEPAPAYLPAPELGSTPATLAATQELTETGKLTGTVRIATLLAKYFDRDVEEILYLHTQEWGFGGIAKALFTAVEAGVPLETILQMREQDIGWGEIRQSLNLPPGMPHASLGQIMGRGHNKGTDWVPPGQAKKAQGKHIEKGPKGKP